MAALPGAARFPATVARLGFICAERSGEMAVSSAEKARNIVTKLLFVRAKPLFHVKHF
ncbi:hypothetical protein [Xanthobacter sp. VNH20]|uniref:hypothetical protein n=1 Tax=Xanthobacter sp. VNH20 TaxID=3156616 RepID=UPI0032B40D4B